MPLAPSTAKRSSPAPVMPAPIVPTTPSAVASAPTSTPSPAAPADADSVSFESLLAAALADPRAVDRDPISWARVGEGAPKAEDAAADPGQTAELPPQALAAAVAAALPLQTATPAPAAGTPTPAAAPALDVLRTSTPVLAALASAAPVASPRIELASKGSATDSAPQLPEAAKIAVPEGDVAFRQPADLLTAQAVAAEVSPNRDTLVRDSSPAADAGVTLVPIAAERPENGARTPQQPVRLDVAAPVGSREFGTEVGNRLAWMATHNHQVAELRIDPPQLGPVEMRLSIANDQASLSIVSPHAAVRDAIQASLPRLQDMLQGLGISLGNVSVGAEGFGQSNFAHAGLDWRQAAEHGLSGTAYPLQGAAAAAILPPRTGLGMIDVYA